MTDTQTDDLFALIGRDTRLKRVASTNGGEYAGPCPFCGGTDRFRVWPEHPGGVGRWWCRQCGKSGDAIAYLVEHGDITPSEAGRLRHGDDTVGVVPGRTAHIGSDITPDNGPPPSAWQGQALRFVTDSETRLWGADRFALNEVRKWGLTDQTIKEWRLGWSTGGAYPRGIEIPHFMGEKLWAVKIRRYVGREPAADPKYTQLSGGRPMLFGADRLRGTNRALLLAEGEKDAVLALQELGDLVDVASLAGATKTIAPRWAMYFLAYDNVLIAYDGDPAGVTGAQNLTRHLRAARRLRLPVGTDLAEFHQLGNSLRAWLLFHLDRLGIVTPRTPARTVRTETGPGSASSLPLPMWMKRAD